MLNPVLQVLVFLPRVHRAPGGHDNRQHTACSVSMAAYWKRMGRHSSARVSLFAFPNSCSHTNVLRITGLFVHAICYSP